MTMDAVLALLGFVAANMAAASSGAVFKPGEWYARLRKPGWTPPNWAFPLVWSVLYLANAAAGFLVWREAGAAAWPALAIYFLSLGFNFAWSVLFFGLRRMDLALWEVSGLWLSIAATLVAFAPISPLAAGLIAPYLAWVSVAALLNLRMVQLNAAALQEQEA